jgi:hypothetical protein
MENLHRVLNQADKNKKQHGSASILIINSGSESKLAGFPKNRLYYSPVS